MSRRLRGATLCVVAAIGTAGLALPTHAEAAPVATHHVRGSVTPEAGGVVEDIYLDLTDSQGFTVGSATASGAAGGSFDMEVVAGGPYTLALSAEPDFDWRTQYYADTYYRADATPITVAGADVDLQPIVLHLQHEVRGLVMAAGRPVTAMRVSAYPAGPGVTTYTRGFSTSTDDDGTYSLYLPPGLWKFRYDGVSNDDFSDTTETWATEWYPDVSSFTEATPVAVPAVNDLGTTTLTKGGTITGQVTDATTGQPARKVDVQVVDADNRFRGDVVTTNDGEWAIGLLSSGSYKVKVEDKQAHGFVTEYWNDAATNATATPVQVVADGKVGGIDVALARTPPPDPATVDLSGVVTDQDGVPELGVRVEAWSSCNSSNPASLAYTGVDGRFAFTDLTAAAYRLAYRDTYGTQEDEEDDSFELIGGWSGSGDRCSTASPVALGTTNADAHLTRAGGISGTLLTELGQPVRESEVELYDLSYFGGAYIWTSRVVHEDGVWSFGDLAPGSYELRFVDQWDDYVPLWWQDVYSQEQAAHVTVQPGVMISGLDGHAWNKPRCEARPVITGNPAPGQTLSTAGMTCLGHELSYSYEWWAEQPYGQNEHLVGTGMSYAVTSADLGYRIEVRLRVAGPDGQSGATSESVYVAPPPPPPPPPPVPRLVSSPTVAGDPTVGSVLTMTPGTWADAGDLTFSYDWLRNGVSVASGTTYTVQPADQGALLQARETAHRGSSTNSGLSAPLRVPIGQIIRARARVLHRDTGRRPTVRLLLRISAPQGVVVPTSMVQVRENGQQVGGTMAGTGRYSVDLRSVRPGRHVYEIAFLGYVGGSLPPPTTVKVKVRRQHAS